MQLAFPPDIEDFVQQQLSSGKYGDSKEEVILAALQLWKQQEDIYKGRLPELQRDVQIGLDDLRAGRVLDGPTAMAKIRANLRARHGSQAE